MQLINGKLIIGVADNIKHPSNIYSSFMCDGVEVVINNLTLLRLYSILEVELKMKGHTIDDLAEELLMEEIK